MLKALELVGFKSFADKTRFEFPAGITVVVGPNGSGKSNVVDAIKWVLGEQSAKSLRGKEMSDVIFKGAGGEVGRKPANSAEATLVFDNLDGRLPVDAPEVQITRRVYRSGEGEYLINRQPARMKDIKDLFRGTGVGADAYSIIEQGRVDKLLQASSKDRRAIFEEAAGISRFKAKKVETQRRLERVDQNLLRLSDIVEEVESRLKTVRNQASKARKYREYTQRLQQLRTQVALVDWRRLSERLQALEKEVAEHRTSVVESSTKGDSVELQLSQQVIAADELAVQVRAAEQRFGSLREQIAQQEATSEHQRQRCQELEEVTKRQRTDLAVLSSRADDVRQKVHEAQAELQTAEQAFLELEQVLAQRQGELARFSQDWESLRQKTEARRGEHVRHVQEAGRIATRRQTCELELNNARAAALNCQEQGAQIQRQLELLAGQIAAEEQTEAKHAAELAAVQKQIDRLVEELEDNRRLLASRQDDWTQLEGRRHGLAGREAFLDEMERTREGLIHGVRELLERVEQTASGPLTRIRGVVADLLQAHVEMAPLIDVALGDAAQFVVVEGTLEDVVNLARQETFATRITLVPSRPPVQQDYVAAQQAAARTFFSWGRKTSAVDHADETSPPETADESHDSPVPQPNNDHGFLGRASEHVEVEPAYAPLIEHLLGGTWLVRTLADALRLHPLAPTGTRFVTKEGEVLEAGGIVVAGPRPTAVGLVSRRSELRTVREELGVVEMQVRDVQDHLFHLRSLIKEQDEKQRELVKATDNTRQELAETRVLLRSQRESQVKLTQQQTAAAAGQRQAVATAEERSGEIAELESQRRKTETAAANLAEELTHDEGRLAEIDHARQQAGNDVTSARVQLAKSEQRLESLRVRMSQFLEDQRERQAAAAQLETQLQAGFARRNAGELQILEVSSLLALNYWEKEISHQDVSRLAAARDALARERSQLTEALQKLRRQQKKAEEELHRLDLAAEGVRHERQTLAGRLREDYNIELAELTHEPSAEEAAERQAVEEEIETLRRKINQIGAVNVDALEEIDNLEERFGHLSGQLQDLTQAKESLAKIIHKINSDSRRLFQDTMEAIRANFQILYRKAFGGGKADIVLEEGVDVLEAGVEIIATPPGKPSFNNSLLSGGEKALTAVALLMAIFQFRPSPFCILDEVDAPFDEANVGRFVDVLKEFLSSTRFVIVTHSKKTMTAAHTLYGVTMQESGVSKRVSVRFDDVDDHGHISSAAVGREEEEDDQERRGVA